MSYETDTVTKLETNLDDLSPEITGAVMSRLFAAGALDVWLTPIQMKKNRPGVMLSVLCEEATVAALTDLIFAETSAFGLRVEKVVRLKLARSFAQVSTEFVSAWCRSHRSSRAAVLSRKNRACRCAPCMRRRLRRGARRYFTNSMLTGMEMPVTSLVIVRAPVVASTL